MPLQRGLQFVAQNLFKVRCFLAVMALGDFVPNETVDNPQKQHRRLERVSENVIVNAAAVGDNPN
jgi:hypothetical protein